MHRMYGIVFLLAATLTASGQTEWRTLRGEVARGGFLKESIPTKLHVQWARFFYGERLGSAMEAIVAQNKVFVNTHNGNVYALDAGTGKPLWRFSGCGAFLHSPAYGGGVVVAADTGGRGAKGRLYGIRADNGRLIWSVSTDWGGCSASPAIAEGLAIIGTRGGEILAVRVADGIVQWRKSSGVCYRQTATYAKGRIYITGEDMRVRCLIAETGDLVWISNPLYGQTARDYYPVVFERNGQSRVAIRTNPASTMSDRIGLDRRFLLERVQVEGDWQSVDRWTKSPDSVGDATRWRKESAAIVHYLEETPEAQTFFILDAQTGIQAVPAPILWNGGCQGVGAPPVVLPDGRLQVFYRSAYGNWNHGVAPLVALGIYDIESNTVTPWIHKNGQQPPWETFWGTADESQNFLVAGNRLWIVHQGTLSHLDLESLTLQAVAGKRDTWGGFFNLPWVRNEWHGPGRGGISVANGRVYWITGSRIVCLALGEAGEVRDEGIQGDSVFTQKASPGVSITMETLKQWLENEVEKAINARWAPLFVEPGLAGREFFFEDSGAVLEAIAWAYPHLPPPLQQKAVEYCKNEWDEYPPYSERCRYSLSEGKRREWFPVPSGLLKYRTTGDVPHPFGNMSAIELYAERCRAWTEVEKEWSAIRDCFEDFQKSGWKIDPETGHRYANRYLGSAIAFREMARKIGDGQNADRADALILANRDSWIAWWKFCMEKAVLPVFTNVLQFDEYRSKQSDTLLIRVGEHKAKLLLFTDLTPELADLARNELGETLISYWQTFERICPTWPLTGEERQVHYGENFVDPPDFSLSAFRAKTWLMNAAVPELAACLDIPACHADWFHILKIAWILERNG